MPTPADHTLDGDTTAFAGIRPGRIARIRGACEDLALWLQDVVRMGGVELQRQDDSFWSSIRTHLVDMQAPGLAHRLQDIEALLRSTTSWEQALARELGRLYLLVQAWRRWERLDIAWQAELLQQAGAGIRREQVLVEAGIAGGWLVLGSRTEVRPYLNIRRTWVRHLEGQEMALLLEFAPGTQSFDPGYAPGDCLRATLHYYPAPYPLRGLLADPVAESAGLPAATGYPLDAALEGYARALAANPFIATYPLAVEGLLPLTVAALRCVRSGICLPLHPRFQGQWELYALAGGRPLAVFGEWDGLSFFPLGARFGDTWVAVGGWTGSKHTGTADT